MEMGEDLMELFRGETREVGLKLAEGESGFPKNLGAAGIIGFAPF